MGVTPSVPVKANSGVRARVRAAGKVLEGDDKPTLLREDQHYLHYITIIIIINTIITILGKYQNDANTNNINVQLTSRDDKPQFCWQKQSFGVEGSTTQFLTDISYVSS